MGNSGILKFLDLYDDALLEFFAPNTCSYGWNLLVRYVCYICPCYHDDQRMFPISYHSCLFGWWNIVSWSSQICLREPVFECTLSDGPSNFHGLRILLCYYNAERYHWHIHEFCCFVSCHWNRWCLWLSISELLKYIPRNDDDWSWTPHHARSAYQIHMFQHIFLHVWSNDVRLLLWWNSHCTDE